MYRYTRHLLVLGQRWDWKVSGAKRLAQGSVQVRLHAWWRMRRIPKRVHEGLAVFTNVEGKKMPRSIMPWLIGSRDKEMLETIPLGEMP